AWKRGKPRLGTTAECGRGGAELPVGVSCPKRTGSADAEEVHDEDEGLAGLDAAAGAGVAVSQVRRDDELAAAAHLHARDALVPAGDDAPAAQRELERLVAVPRGVELLAGGEGDADVVDADLVAGLGLGAVPDDDVLDLQLGGRVAAREVDLRLRECHESAPVDDGNEPDDSTRSGHQLVCSGMPSE